jgi:hypothetical protein
MPRAARARGANPVAAATATTKHAKKNNKLDKKDKRATDATVGKGFIFKNATPPSGDAALVLARRAVPIAIALAAAFAVYATRDFYEKALERSVKTLKRSLEETAALRLELDATLADLYDARAARDALTFQLGKSSAEVRSELQGAQLRLAKTETELECARRELADAASLAARESSRRRRETETLERTIRALESRSRSDGSDEQTDVSPRSAEMMVLEKILSTRVRFAVSGVPADLLRAVSRENAEASGDSETPLRVCVLGTWNDWSENADDIVFLEPRSRSNEALPDAARVQAISPDLVATLALRAGDVYEYKFAVAREKKSSSGAESTTNAVVLEWQTGPNRVLVVPVPGTGDDVDALDAPFVAANDVWSAATTEWRGGEEHSPVTARARSVRAEDSAGDFDHRLETPRETSSVAVAESSSEVANNVTFVDLQIAHREVVDGVVVDGVPSDAGAKKWHPR